MEKNSSYILLSNEEDKKDLISEKEISEILKNKNNDSSYITFSDDFLNYDESFCILPKEIIQKRKRKKQIDNADDFALLEESDLVDGVKISNNELNKIEQNMEFCNEIFKNQKIWELRGRINRCNEFIKKAQKVIAAKMDKNENPEFVRHAKNMIKEIEKEKIRVNKEIEKEIKKMQQERKTGIQKKENNKNSGRFL